MSTASSVLRDEIVEALRSAYVAIAAGVTPAVWGSATTPRVFDGAAGYIGGRNRGRCPFVEVWIGGQSFNRTTLDGGTLVSQVRVRVHATGRDHDTARDLLEAIMAAGLAAIRSTPTDRYTAQGSDEVGEIVPGPMGWQLDATVSVAHSWDRSTYEVQP